MLLKPNSLNLIIIRSYRDHILSLENLQIQYLQSSQAQSDKLQKPDCGPLAACEHCSYPPSTVIGLFCCFIISARIILPCLKSHLPAVSGTRYVKAARWVQVERFAQLFCPMCGLCEFWLGLCRWIVFE